MRNQSPPAHRHELLGQVCAGTFPFASGDNDGGNCHEKRHKHANLLRGNIKLLIGLLNF
jgi:hypothetical protein